MGGNTKIKNLDSFHIAGNIIFTRALIPRSFSQKETSKLLKSETILNVDFNFEKIEKNIEKNKSNLFSHGRKMDFFFTEDSKLYITPREHKLIQKGVKLNRNLKNWDSLSSRIARNYQKYHKTEKDALSKVLADRYDRLKEDISDKSQLIFGQFTFRRAWNFSIVCAVLFGMFNITLIYRYLGEASLADKIASANNNQAQEMQVDAPAVLGATNEKESFPIQANADNQPEITQANDNADKDKSDESDENADTGKYNSIEKMINDKFNDKIALAIADAESHFNPVAYHKNSNGTVDCGVFQINSVHNPTKKQCDNPKANIDLAYQIYQKKGYDAWTTFTSGKYKKYIE